MYDNNLIYSRNNNNNNNNNRTLFSYDAFACIYLPQIVESRRGVMYHPFAMIFPPDCKSESFKSTVTMLIIIVVSHSAVRSGRVGLKNACALLEHVEKEYTKCFSLDCPRKLAVWRA